MRNILVVYYSWGNNIKAVAEYLSQKLGADLLELKPKEAYPTDYDACVRKVGRDGAAYEPELEGKTSDLSSYNGVFVGSPCWWGTIANPVRTFLHQDDFSGKTVVLFMTHATSGLHVQDVTKLCPGAKVLNGHGVFNSYQVSTKKTRRKIWEITRRILTGGFERSDSDISFLRRPTIFNKKI